jgi:phosphoserine aminotransferase
MLAVEDALDGLRWAESIGGLPELIKRSDANLNAVRDWVAVTPWVEFLAVSPQIVSNTSICLKIVDPGYTALSKDEQEAKAKEIVSLMSKEKVAYDIGSYRDAPTGLRIWGGATVETSDMKAILPWLDWAFGEICSKKTAA